MMMATMALFVAACGSSGESGSDTTAPPPTDAPVVVSDQPIRLGSVNSITGPVPFPEASAAAAAYFDRLNANGGIGGRMIEYTVEDDAADPALASAAARKLIDSGVAMLVGGASLLECSVNAAYYKDSGVYSVPGTGVDPVCFSASNIAPVNTGPYQGVTVNLYYASEVLGYNKIVYQQADVGLGKEIYEAQIGRWEKLTGKKLVAFDFFPFGGDMTPFVAKAVSDGADLVFHGGIEPTCVAWMQAVKAQSAKLDTIAFTSCYSDGVAKALGSPDNKFYANSEFEPYSNVDAATTADWRALMTEAKVPLTSFAEGGYLAALYVEQVLSGINGIETLEGDDLRKAVGAALLAMEPISNPMVGSPYVFGDAPAHNPNRASKFVEVVAGTWKSLTDDFIVLPDEK